MADVVNARLPQTTILFALLHFDFISDFWYTCINHHSFLCVSRGTKDLNL